MQVPARVVLFFRLDQQVGVAGDEEIRLDHFAKIRRQFRRVLEFLQFFGRGGLNVRGHDDARIENGERNRVGRRA